jgi:hypothetical protein
MPQTPLFVQSLWLKAIIGDFISHLFQENVQRFVF